MTDHDKAIIEAAEEVVTDFATRRLISPCSPLHRLEAAIHAKREAARPRLLTAAEALAAYLATGARMYNSDGIQAVLDADRASIVRVIEAVIDDGSRRAETNTAKCAWRDAGAFIKSALASP